MTPDSQSVLRRPKRQGSGGVLAVIDRIEREQYVNGMRCSDFKEALDAVREALT